jgi:hypothetical protein
MIFNMLLSLYCTSSITNFLTAGPNVWFPIILIAVLTIIAIVAVIYALSPLLGRNDIKVWARAKIYDGFITIIFAAIFVSFSTTICFVNPAGAFSALGILPNSCDPAIQGNTPSSYGVTTDIYGISLCDLYQFNAGVGSFLESLYWISMFGGLNPEFSFYPSLPDFPINPLTGSGVGIAFSFQLFPIVLVHQYVIPYVQAIFAAILVSQLLQILLSSSMLLLSIFLILGLLARSFSITKSFGGAMIAFAIGLGFVYPFMAAITYGFIDTAIQNAQTTACSASYFSSILPPASGGVCALYDLAPLMLTGLLSIPINAVFSGTFSFVPLFTPLIIYVGFVAAGLILIPLLNLIVVDAFIVDFSKAIGERMDLFSILTRII